MKSMADLFKGPQKSVLDVGMWAAKVIVLVVAVASAIVMASWIFVPYAFDIVSSTLPRLKLSPRSWLVPTHVFIFIQPIIMIIWKLSKKKEHKDDDIPDETKTVEVSTTVKLGDPNSEPSPDIWHDVTPSPAELRDVPLEAGAKTSPDRSSDNESCVTVAEEEEEDDSMEATWKAIMEGGASPVRKYLAKSETWPEPRGRLERAAAAGGVKEMRKSRTCKEVATVPIDMGWRQTEVLLMGRDELNLRFEQFIKKNHDHLRLQRQESHQRYLDMVNRAY